METMKSKLKNICIKGYRAVRILPFIMGAIILTAGKAESQNNPSVSVRKANIETVKKYEKFELLLDLKNVEIDNPYDPEDIDKRLLRQLQRC
jgi:hypothetical protein